MSKGSRLHVPQYQMQTLYPTPVASKLLPKPYGNDLMLKVNGIRDKYRWKRQDLLKEDPCLCQVERLPPKQIVHCCLTFTSALFSLHYASPHILYPHAAQIINVLSPLCPYLAQTKCQQYRSPVPLAQFSSLTLIHLNFPRSDRIHLRFLKIWEFLGNGNSDQKNGLTQLRRKEPTAKNVDGESETSLFESLYPVREYPLRRHLV